MKVIFNLKLITALLMCLMFVCACKQSKSIGGSGSTSTTNKNSSGTSGAFSPSGDARKDLGDALRKLNTSFPYRLTETTSTSSSGQTVGQETTRVVEFAAADRSHVKLTGGAGDDFEHITIGDKNYSKLNGKWTEERSSTTERKSQGVDLEKNLADAIKEVTYAGPETVNGVPCFAYNYTLQVDAYTGKGKTWVRASDGLPHQSDSEFKYGNYGSKSHIIYEYNVDVSIKAPI